MQWSELTTYLWLLLPIGVYGVVAVAVEVLGKRLPIIKHVKLAIHLIALGLGLRLAVLYLLPERWAKVLGPWSVALLVFAALVLFIQLVEALAVGYLMGTLQKRKIPLVLRKATLLIAYFVTALIILHTYLDLDVTSLLATSAVVSFVVGLASQDLLGSILAGIAIGVEKPIAKDNWVEIDGREGRVVDVTWRRTRIQTRDGDFVMVPNHLVMKNTIVNHTMPNRNHRMRILVGVHYSHAPNYVKASMLKAATKCGDVLSSPPPTVFLEDFDDSAIVYRLNAWIDGMARIEAIGDEIRTLIWYQFQRDRITIPFPIRTWHREPPPPDPQQEAMARAERILPALRASEIFSPMSTEALNQAAMGFTTAAYGAGEVLFHEGDQGSEFYMILSGKAGVIAQVGGGAQTRLATLGPGDCFGEMSLLLDQKRGATIRLEEDSELVVVDRPMFSQLMEDHPDFLEYLTKLVEERTRDNAEVMAMFAEQKAETTQGRMRALLGRIKGVLGIS